MVKPLWIITIRWFLKILNIELSYDSTILFLGPFPKELKAGTQLGISTAMFTAELFSRAKR